MAEGRKLLFAALFVWLLPNVSVGSREFLKETFVVL